MKTHFRLILGSVIITLAGASHAVPWCHQGTIINNYGSKNFSHSELLTVQNDLITSGDLGYQNNIDPQAYVAYTATHAHAQVYADAAGPNWNNVPGHGQVRTRIIAPYTLTNMVGPGYYYISQGAQAKYDKCFGGPIPMREERTTEVR